MKFTSTLIAAGSGSIGGLTVSHNRGGQYLRRKVIPTNPTTTLRTAAKGAFGSLATYWSQTLTPAEREAWNTYAANVSVLDKLGETRYLTGMQWFIANNSPFVQAFGTIIDAAPTEFSVGPSITNEGSVTFVADDQQFGVGSALLAAGLPIGSEVLIYLGRPLNPSINFFKGPYKRATAITTTAVADVIALAGAPDESPYVYSVGQVVPYRVIARLADGRVCPQWEGKVVVTAGA